MRQQLFAKKLITILAARSRLPPDVPRAAKMSAFALSGAGRPRHIKGLEPVFLHRKVARKLEMWPSHKERPSNCPKKPDRSPSPCGLISRMITSLIIPMSYKTIRST
jgi:hypothetical protein